MDDETRQIIDSIMDETPQNIDAKVKQAPHTNLTQPVKITDLIHHYNEKVEPPEFIGGIFPRGYVSMIFGDPSRGKTFLSTRLTADLSVGGAILGGVVARGEPARRVLVLNAEAGNYIPTLRIQEAGYNFNPENIGALDATECEEAGYPISVSSEEGIRPLADVADNFKPDIIIIDSIVDFIANENDREEGGKVMKLLRQLARREYNGNRPALVITNHPRKRANGTLKTFLTLDDLVGSSVYAKTIAFALALEEREITIPGISETPSKKNVASCAKSWFKRLAPFAYEISERTNERGAIYADIDFYGPIEISTGNSAPKRSSAVDAIKTALDVAGEAGIQRKDVLQVAPNISAETVKQTLTRMVQQREIFADGDGRGRRYFSEPPKAQ